MEASRCTDSHPHPAADGRLIADAECHDISEGGAKGGNTRPVRAVPYLAALLLHPAFTTETELMNPPLEFAAAIVLPIAAVYSLIGGARLLQWLSEQQSRPQAPEPIERLRGQLVRLRAQLEDMETRSDQPAKNLRIRALRAAYVEALVEACQRLDITPPVGARARSDIVKQSDIYRMEAALRERGLDVREAAAH